MRKNPVRDYRSVEMVISHQHCSQLGLQPTKTEVANLRLAIQMVLNFSTKRCKPNGLLF
ncbi:MAG: hypothetical protein LBT27_02585 [Prevotellaceae bacterium]|jgi:hypothetical protein|nr:hypothetical protein [Prevotellaceae bacterium]